MKKTLFFTLTCVVDLIQTYQDEYWTGLTLNCFEGLPLDRNYNAYSMTCSIKVILSETCHCSYPKSSRLRHQMAQRSRHAWTYPSGVLRVAPDTRAHVRRATSHGKSANYRSPNRFSAEVDPEKGGRAGLSPGGKCCKLEMGEGKAWAQVQVSRGAWFKEMPNDFYDGWKSRAELFIDLKLEVQLLLKIYTNSESHDAALRHLRLPCNNSLLNWTSD